jgi:hypothetical protein
MKKIIIICLIVLMLIVGLITGCSGENVENGRASGLSAIMSGSVLALDTNELDGLVDNTNST